jgi:hypothetical protein
MSAQRHPDEKFETYKKRMKLQQVLDKVIRKGKLVWQSTGDGGKGTYRKGEK